MKFLIVVPVYNRADLLERCLESIAAQDDPDFEVYITDDCSPEWDEIRPVLDRYVPTEGWNWGRQGENTGATRNIVDTIRGWPMDPDDVVLLVDGDDRLPHAGVVSRLRKVYEGTDVLVSYGSYQSEPFNANCPAVRPYPLEVLLAGNIREFTKRRGAWFNHPLSFRRAAFDAISDSEFQRRGEWLRYGYDLTLMMPLIEIAGPRVVYQDEILYTYTSDRADSDWCAHGPGVRKANQWVLRQGRQHRPIPYPSTTGRLLESEDKAEVIGDIAENHGLTALVETGTGYGTIPFLLADRFDQIVTIEPEDDAYNTSAERLEGHDNVRVVQGRSESELGTVLADLGQPCMIFLDAHEVADDGHSAMSAELGIIADDGKRHLVLIDDARLFRDDKGWWSLRSVEDWAVYNDYRLALMDDIVRLVPQ